MRLFPVVCLSLVALLLGLPSLTVAYTTAPAATPGAAGSDFSGLVEIGNGRRLWLECRGTGKPTVVLEAGYRSPASIWIDDLIQPDDPRTMVLAGVATFTRVCTYERPGTVADVDGVVQPSRSDPVPMPRTARDVVADLHVLLSAAGVPGPYVLVGHSFGGLFARLYASTYPGKVVGLVLVDALPEGMQVLLRPDEWEQYQRLNNQVLPGLEDYHDLETLDFATSFAQMREAASESPLPQMPLVVLSHGQPFGVPADVLGFSPEALERAWAAGQHELAALLPGARHDVAAESGHYIQLDQPALVIDAIRQVVAAVRDPAMWAVPAASPAAAPDPSLRDGAGE